MSLSEWKEKTKGLDPDVRERVMTITCTRWLQLFNKQLSESPHPEKLVAENNVLIAYSIVQLTKMGECRKTVYDFFITLEQKNPFTTM